MRTQEIWSLTARSLGCLVDLFDDLDKGAMLYLIWESSQAPPEHCSLNPEYGLYSLGSGTVEVLLSCFLSFCLELFFLVQRWLNFLAEEVWLWLWVSNALI